MDGLTAEVACDRNSTQSSFNKHLLAQLLIEAGPKDVNNLIGHLPLSSLLPFAWIGFIVLQALATGAKRATVA